MTPPSGWRSTMMLFGRVVITLFAFVLWATAVSAQPAPSSTDMAPSGASPSGTGQETADAEHAEVKVRDAPVYIVRTGRAGRSAVERAALATQGLERALESAEAHEVRIEPSGAETALFVGPHYIITLDIEDARRAGDDSLDVHAAQTADLMREALRRERQRSQIAKTVFSLSLAVFLGLIAIYLIGKLGQFARRLRTWLADESRSLPALRLQSSERGPAVLHSIASVVLPVGRLLAQGGIVYTWLVVVLSLFDSTRSYTDRLTGLLVAPLSALMGRVATSLPLVVVALTAGLALAVLVRFVGVYFEDIERGDADASWISPKLARPTSMLLRIGIVIATLAFAAPIVTGDPESALARTGIIALAALGVALVPVLATGAVGAVLVYRGRIRHGEHVEIGDERGRVVTVNLLDTVIESGDGVTVGIPHLLTLVRPTRRLGLAPRVHIEIHVASEHGGEALVATIRDAADSVGEGARVALVGRAAGSRRYRVSVKSADGDAESALLGAVVEALEDDAITVTGAKRGPGR
jgi:small-conductance mechanosensitive channel